MTAKFSSSLRKRPSWASVVDVLNKAPRVVKWIESKLETQDLIVPLIMTADTDGDVCFRFLLLSSVDLDSAATETRLDRFYTLDKHIAIVFLDETVDSSAFVGFQIRMMQSRPDVPIISIKSTESLPTMVIAFCQRFVTTPPRMPKTQAVRALLPFCTINPPIREHDFNLLSDIVPSFKGMVEAISTRQGQEHMSSYIGQADVQDIVTFWTSEYIT